MKKGWADLLVVVPLALLLFAHGVWEIVTRHGWSAPKHGRPIFYAGTQAVAAGVSEALLGCLLVAGWIASRPGHRRQGLMLAGISLAGSLLVGLALAAGLI